MASYNFFQPEISKNYGTMEWREDIKNVMKKAGAEGKPTTFLIADSQIKQVRNFNLCYINYHDGLFPSS